MAVSFREVAPGRLQIREGGGAIGVFGVPFFAAGVFAILGTLGIVPISNPGGASGFARPMLGLTVGRRIVRKWGLLVPLREDIAPLDEYLAVTIGFVRGDSDTADKFPIGLKSRTGGDVTLFNPTTYADARTCAVAIAQHLHLDLEDATTDHPTRQPCDQLDRPFQNRAQRPGAQEPAVSPPPDARSTVTRDADGLQILIPGTPAECHRCRRGSRSTGDPGDLRSDFGGVLRANARAGLRQPDIPRCVRPRFRRRARPHMPECARAGATWPDDRVGFARGHPRPPARSVANEDGCIHRGGDIVDVDYSTRESASAAARRAAEQQALAAYGKAVAAGGVSPRAERVLLALARFARSGGITIKTTRGLTTFGEGLEDEEVRYLHSVIRRALH